MGKLVRGVTDLATVRPDLAAEWHPALNGELTPRDVTSGSGKKAWWLCAEAHEWEALVSNRHKGSGCPYCSGRLAIVGLTDLATNNPDLALQWHPAMNGVVTPRNVMSNSHGKAWWLCTKGHEWEATIATRSRGSGCPVCAGLQILVGFNDLETTNPDLAAQWHPTKNGDLTPRDVVSGARKKAWWLCRDGHEWEAVIGSRHSGRNCPVCLGRQTLMGFNDLATKNPSLASEWHPTKNDGLTTGQVTPSSNKKAWWRCSEGHEWEAVIARRQAGNGCAVCGGQKVLVGFNDLGTTNPDLAAQWHPKKNGDLSPRDVISGAHKKAWWLCSEGHEWEAVIGNRHSGNGCPVCSGQQVLVGFNDLESKNPALAAEWHPKKNAKLTPRDVTTGANRKAWWLCSEGHEWEATISSRHSGNGCAGCAKYGFDPTSPAYLYLLRKEHLSLQQFGITNRPEVRLGIHRRKGWELLDILGPADGVWIVETEAALGRFFQAKGLLLPRDYPDKFDGFSESWRSDELSFSTCAEMLEALRDWEPKI